MELAILPEVRYICTENISNRDDADIDKFHDSIISFIKKSASLCIPLTSNKNGRDPLPFWNKQCQNACNQNSASNKKYKFTKQLTDFIIFKKQRAFCQRINVIQLVPVFGSGENRVVCAKVGCSVRARTELPLGVQFG